MLYRASVSSLPEYADVNLGRHEAKLRKLLLNRNPGSPFDYAITGQYVINPQSQRLVQVVTRPIVYRIDSHRYFTMAYGGVEWWVKLSSHRHKCYEERFLSCDGKITFNPVWLDEIPVIQQASAILRSSP